MKATLTLEDRSSDLDEPVMRPRGLIAESDIVVNRHGRDYTLVEKGRVMTQRDARFWESVFPGEIKPYLKNAYDLELSSMYHG